MIGKNKVKSDIHLNKDDVKRYVNELSTKIFGVYFFTDENNLLKNVIKLEKEGGTFMHIFVTTCHLFPQYRKIY